MNTASQNIAAKLRAARRSHCNTCGCARCRRIDQLLEQFGQSLQRHPEIAGAWLIEGRLLWDETGHWSVQAGDTITPLNKHLCPWVGYNVTILIGVEPATTQ